MMSFAGWSPSPPPRRRTVGHFHVAVAATEFLQHLLHPLLPRRRTLGPPDPAEGIVGLIGRALPVLRLQAGGQQGAANVNGHGVTWPARRGALRGVIPRPSSSTPPPGAGAVSRWRSPPLRRRRRRPADCGVTEPGTRRSCARTAALPGSLPPVSGAYPGGAG